MFHHRERWHAERMRMDQELLDWQCIKRFKKPEKGCIHAFRHMLGIRLEDLAGRMGFSASAVHQMEQREFTGCISLKVLEHAAKSMNCELRYLFLPKTSLQSLLEERAVEALKNPALESADVSLRAMIRRFDRRLWQIPDERLPLSARPQRQGSGLWSRLTSWL